MSSPHAYSSPRVSVLLPVRDGERYLELAIQSVLEQQFEDFELIVIDDGSADNSLAITAGFGDSRIRHTSHQAPEGLAEALNTGLRLVRAPMVARIDADDLMLPERLTCQVQFLEHHPSIDVVGSQLTLIDETGAPGGVMGFPESSDAAALRLFLGRNPVPHPGLLARTSALKSVGGYRPVQNSHDFELFLRLATEGCQFYNLPEELTRYRVHAWQISLLSVEERLDVRGDMFRHFLESILGYAPPVGEVRNYLAYWGFEQPTSDAISAHALVSQLIQCYLERFPAFAGPGVLTTALSRLLEESADSFSATEAMGRCWLFDWLDSPLTTAARPSLSHAAPQDPTLWAVE